jgi:3-oxoadipate enol-lactonase
MPLAHLNGIGLYYERSGSGPPLLFLNGTGATLASAGGLATVFAGDFEVAAFDQRGLGRSEIPSAPYGMAELAADALAVADELEWDHFRLIGISFGGMVAQELAVTVPNRIDRLALLCTSAGGAGGSSFPLQTLTDMDPIERVVVSAQILDNRFTPEWLESHEDDKALAALLAQRFTVDRSADVRRGEELQLLARSQHDVYDRLPRIACPSLVAAGRYDGIAPLANAAAIVAQMPNAELQVFEGGHVFFMQDPNAFPEILAFLRNADTLTTRSLG